jgi:hypothetical protein
MTEPESAPQVFLSSMNIYPNGAMLLFAFLIAALPNPSARRKTKLLHE